MDIRCHCRACDAKFTVGNDLAGEAVRCVKCGKTVLAPATNATPVAEPLASDDNLADLIGLTAAKKKPPYPVRKPEPHKRTKSKKAKDALRFWVITGCGMAAAALLATVVLVCVDHSPNPSNASLQHNQQRQQQLHVDVSPTKTKAETDVVGQRWKDTEYAGDTKRVQELPSERRQPPVPRAVDEPDDLPPVPTLPPSQPREEPKPKEPSHVEEPPPAPIPDVPQRAAGMSAEEFLKQRGLVKSGRTWVLPIDKDLIPKLHDLRDKARSIKGKIEAADKAEVTWKLAAKSRWEAKKEQDAFMEKLQSGVPVFIGEKEKVDRGVEVAEKAAKAAEEAKVRTRSEAMQAAEAFPKLDQLRRDYNVATRYYAKLTGNAAVIAAVDELGDWMPDKKFLLGPTSSFRGAVKEIQEIEKTAAMPASWVPREVAVDIRKEGDESYVQVELNGRKTLEMVVDSGAETVSLTWRMAEELGLNPANGKTVRLGIANGQTYLAKMVTIPIVRVGGAVARNVECTVDPPQNSSSPLLLGMSFLKRFQWKLNAVESKLIFSEVIEDNAELQAGTR